MKQARFLFKLHLDWVHMQKLPSPAYIMDSTQGVQANPEAEFPAQKSDIILASAPKSGTTWLKALVFSIVYRAQYPISDPKHPLHTNNPHALVPHMHPINTEENFSVSSFTTSPRLFSSHVSYPLLPKFTKFSKSRIIYLFRNPKEVFVSMWYFVNMYAPKDMSSPEEEEPITLKEAFDSFCNGDKWFEARWKHALQFRKLSLERPEEVMFLKYEDLKEDITTQLKKIAKYLGCPFSPEEERDGVIEGLIRLCSFEHMSNFDVNETGERALPLLASKEFFSKGELGDWKNVLTPPMVAQLDKLLGKKLRNSGLTFL